MKEGENGGINKSVPYHRLNNWGRGVSDQSLADACSVRSGVSPRCTNRLD